MLPEFLKTKQKIAERQNAFFKWAVDQHMPPRFREIPKRAMYEGGIIKSRHSDAVSYQTPVERIATNFTVSTSEVLANPDIMFEKLWDSAPAFANQQTINMIDAISNATTAVGNSYHVQDVTPEVFLDMIERLEITFQDNGDPRLPEILAGPQMMEKFSRMESAYKANPEYSKRFTEIINKKRTQWYDRQASRKLVE